MHRYLLAATFSIASLFATDSSQAQEITKTDSAKTNVGTDKVVDKVEIEASVNAVAWRSHLEEALMKPLKKATKKGIKPGLYVVNVRFLVERDGSISSATALNDPGYGLAEASEKVILTGPRWKAGEQNGRKVRSYHTQPIGFQITEE